MQEKIHERFLRLEREIAKLYRYSAEHPRQRSAALRLATLVLSPSHGNAAAIAAAAEAVLHALHPIEDDDDRTS